MKKSFLAILALILIVLISPVFLVGFIVRALQGSFMIGHGFADSILDITYEWIRK